MMKLLKYFAPVFFLLLASCEEPKVENTEPPINVGTVVYVKMGGHHYKSEATHVNEGVVAWTYFWKKQPIWKFKTYRGLLNIYSEESGFRFWTKFDVKLIDSFFPMVEGKEISFEGTQHSEKEDLTYPFWAHISVREEQMIMIKDREYPVFVLDFTFIEERPDGTLTFTKTAWYSQDLEMSLKTEYTTEDKSFVIRVVSMDTVENYEEEEEYEPEGLGTVRL